MFEPIIVYHSINNFLGTTPGLLVRESFELVLFTVVLYMLVSEYTRIKKITLQYLIIAFISLVIEELMIVFILVNNVFGHLGYSVFSPYIPVIDGTFEVFALILMAAAFFYPVFRKEPEKFRNLVNIEIAVLLVISAVIEICWIIKTFNYPDADFSQDLGFFVFEIIKIIVFSIAIYIMSIKRKQLDKYTGSVNTAFIVYLITPVLNIINIIFYNNNNVALTVSIYPFTFLSVLLLTRVIYLKLADKAALKEQLNVTKQQYVQEKELSKLKDDFVSVVSHELKTPLTSLKLYLSILKDNKNGSIAKDKKTIRIMEEETDRLTNLINDILSLARLESKKEKLNIEKTDMHDLVKNSISTYMNLAEEKNIKVINKIPKKFFVNIDKEKFKQVFINLFSNAVKYANSEIVVWVGKTSNEFRMYVQDDGKGIDNENLEKIFDKFYQIEEHTTRNISGTGLGLTIAKHIVELHNGRIEVHSDLGKGSTFTVIMPQE